MTALHQSAQMARSHKMLLWMPLLLFPLLTLLFWAAGGGKNGTANEQNIANGGLNLQLPDAQIKSDKETDKLSFYQQANQDSLKKEEEKRNDPFWSSIGNKDSLGTVLKNHDEQKTFGIDYNPLPPSTYSNNSIDANEAKVYEKLAKLNSALAQSKELPKETRINNDNYSGGSSSASDTKKLEAMMRGMNESSGKDPELDQLNTMLDKIAAIQRPDEANRLSLADDSSVNKNTIAVHGKKKSAIVSLLQSGTSKNNQPVNKLIQKAGFYNDASSTTAIDSGKVNTCGAIIPQTQVVASGATVQLQLSQDIDINGISVRKGSSLFGIASLSNERLLIKIGSIQSNNNVYPVSLDVYDLDGLAGVYVPGSMTRETAKQSADRAISGIGLTTLDPSLGAQAASAGIEAARSLISKKAKLVKVTVPAGYQILLRDSHSN